MSLVYLNAMSAYFGIMVFKIYICFFVFFSSFLSKFAIFFSFTSYFS